MIHLGILINACHWYWLCLNSCWKVQTHMRTHHRSNFIFLILVNPNPINLLKCILRFVLNFNIASSLNRKLMSITTVVITLARVTSGASSVKSSTNLRAFVVFKQLFNFIIILNVICCITIFRLFEIGKILKSLPRPQTISKMAVSINPCSAKVSVLAAKWANCWTRRRWLFTPWKEPGS